jgi:hypothetical protein
MSSNTANYEINIGLELEVNPSLQCTILYWNPITLINIYNGYGLDY